MRPPRGRGGGGFRGGRDGGRGGRGGGRGFGGRGPPRDEGPPAEVIEVSTFVHACEGDAVTKLTNEKIPYFNAPIYLQNKTQIGKVDEIFGPINESFFSIKMSEGIVATSYSAGDKFFIDPAKLLPLSRFLPQPKSFMLLSASVNSISSIPSPVYQCKKAFRLNMAVNCSLTLLNISWMDVEFPTKVDDIDSPLGGISHTLDFTLFGIHSTKYEEFLFCTLIICSSTSLVLILPLNMAEAVR
nr:putative H/ACA ribonucleoprotein complex subunit 1-like protein 1 [Ipomoea batatas]